MCGRGRRSRAKVRDLLDYVKNTYVSVDAAEIQLKNSGLQMGGFHLCMSDIGDCHLRTPRVLIW